MFMVLLVYRGIDDALCENRERVRVFPVAFGRLCSNTHMPQGLAM